MSAKSCYVCVGIDLMVAAYTGLIAHQPLAGCLWLGLAAFYFYSGNRLGKKQ